MKKRITMLLAKWLGVDELLRAANSLILSIDCNPTLEDCDETQGFRDGLSDAMDAVPYWEEILEGRQIEYNEEIWGWLKPKCKSDD